MDIQITTQNNVVKLNKPEIQKDEDILLLYVAENCTNGVSDCCGVGGKDQCKC